MTAESANQFPSRVCKGLTDSVNKQPARSIIEVIDDETLTIRRVDKLRSRESGFLLFSLSELALDEVLLDGEIVIGKPEDDPRLALSDVLKVVLILDGLLTSAYLRAQNDLCSAKAVELGRDVGQCGSASVVENISVHGEHLETSLSTHQRAPTR